MQYQAWVDQGYLIATPGNVTDYDYIKQVIKEQHELAPITQLFYDMWNSSQLLGQLADEGLNVKPVSQGIASISPGAKMLERMALSKAINHQNNPVLRWMNSNVMLRTDQNENIKPDKKKSTEKIDGMIAIIMAVVGWLKNSLENEADQSPYNKRGLRVLGEDGWNANEAPEEPQ